MASIAGDSFFQATGEAVVLPTAAPVAVACVKVLHLVNGDLYAGAERVQDLLALRIGDFGYQLGFAGLKRGRFAADRQSLETPLFDVTMRSRFDLSVARRVATIVREGGYQLLHTHTPRTAIVGRMAASIAGVPMIHHLHSPATADTEHFWRNQFNAQVERWSLSRTARLIAVSQSVADHARRRGLAAGRITVVHNGVPTQGPLVERSTPCSPWTLGTVALFRPRKGLEVLIDALATLREHGLDVRLRAVGPFETAEYENQIKAQVERLNLQQNIEWVGFSRDVHSHLRTTDLFVLPSLYGEGLPMVVLEAMSMGVPVVATRVEGVPEAVRDGLDGLIASPSNAADLARQIARTVQGEVNWQSLRASAYRRQAEQFSDRSMAAGVARVYDEVLCKR